MKNNLTLGSLFDGSGGFPLGGMISGITPLWNSEIEPFPIRVTTKRFPNMEHYSDVSKLNGAELPPVDIITFGSPCQDMSIAGKRAGLDGNRSSLFHEAIRIIKEMRGATNEKYPRYIVWENVPGAFSSNKGKDFKAVIESICSIKADSVLIPEPPKGKWTGAGHVGVADGFDIAWRTVDAQYWGVPQRRKRIYLVADFAGGSAGKILFESEGLSGYSAESFRAWQGTATCVESSTGKAGSTGRICLNDQGGERVDSTEDTVPVTLKIRSGCEGDGKGALIQNNLSATLGCNNDQTLFQPVGSLDCRNIAVNPELSGTLQAKNNGGFSLNYINPVVYGICSKDSNSMKSDNPNSGFYKATTARCLDANGGNPGCNQGGIAIVEQQTFALQGNMIGRKDENGPQPSPTTYTVRRLTPTECGRLQGFPDWWCDDLATENPTQEEIEYWREVFETHRKVIGTSTKPKSEKQIIKWLKDPYSDSAEYKMWGNGVALPNVVFVLSGIVWADSRRE